MSTHKTPRHSSRKTSPSLKASSRTKQRKDRTIGTSLRDKKKYTFSGYSQVSPKIIVSVIALIGICVAVFMRMPSCSSLNATTEALTESINVKDKIEPGTPASLEEKLIPILTRNEKISWIAANTSKYIDPRIVELALREPEAVDFVYDYPNNPPAPAPYTKGVQKGTAPVLYCWNSNWGAVDYGGLPLAVTGSGPAVMSMAYMGTFGKNDKSPADMAELAKSGGYVTEKGVTVADFFLNTAGTLGLECREVDRSEQTVSLALSKRHFLIAHMITNTHPQDEGHWILIADHAQTGALVIHDPTSTENTKQLWDGSQLLQDIDKLYVISEAQKEQS